jgi:TRAP-type C4-dicarboxylate transport system substrate-binding protein
MLCNFFLVMQAGLEVEWNSFEKQLRKAIKQHVRQGSVEENDMNVQDEDQQVQIAEEETVERLATVLTDAVSISKIISI